MDVPSPLLPHWVQALMHVGREGVKTKELLELVCKLRLADWEVTKSKQSTVSAVISKEPRFVRVSHYKYTLRCFPGVVEFKRESSGQPSTGRPRCLYNCTCCRNLMRQ